MKARTGYPVMVVVAAKEAAQRDTNAVTPTITGKGDMAFAGCIVAAIKG